MSSRAASRREGFAPRFLVPLSLVLALSPVGFGCKEHGSSEQDTRPLPAPEPPASTSPSLPRDDAPSAPKRKSSDEDDAPAKAKRPSTDPSDENAPSAAAPEAAAAPTPATGAATGDAAPATAPSAAGQLAAPSAACLARCQAALQSCLSAPVDGGVPGFGNLEICKKAGEACQSTCSKQ